MVPVQSYKASFRHLEKYISWLLLCQHLVQHSGLYFTFKDVAAWLWASHNYTKLWRITHTGLHIKKKLIFGHYSGLNSRSNSGPIFDSISSRIPLDPLAVYSSTTVYIYKLLFPDSSKNLTFTLKNLAYNLVFDSILTRGRVTLVWSNKFMTWLLLSLGLNLAIFASSTNVESGPRFAGIWIILFRQTSIVVNDHQNANSVRGKKSLKLLVVVQRPALLTLTAFSL